MTEFFGTTLIYFWSHPSLSNPPSHSLSVLFQPTPPQKPGLPQSSIPVVRGAILLWPKYAQRYLPDKGVSFHTVMSKAQIFPKFDNMQTRPGFCHCRRRYIFTRVNTCCHYKSLYF
ncbi:hypothetical protein CXB51_005029 [Gossypium anomalum]|uniref:Uncharacterized protein n=1 Tax=Gossypium anomalum TaxID=47600 RepID=A0A8J6D993_9ROSI|nr:hypothetical protein CXB51_005029 [Gossypium anomalum]